MDVVLIFNGLGNQMSQYAFFLSKKRYNKRCIAFFVPSSRKIHNGSELEKVFNIQYVNFFTRCCISILYRLYKTTNIGKKIGIRFYKEPQNYDYNYSFISQGDAWLNFFWGGWHCEKYFSSIKPDILNVFTFKENNENDLSFNKIKTKIQQTPNSVSIHIRRGDYLNQPANSIYKFDKIATLEYYKKAIAYIKSIRGNCCFFIFSNDLDWCKEQFHDDDFFFIDCNTGDKAWRDMYLMTKCRDHIIANSSFSWWGAWLGSNDGITIHPKQFIRDMVTKDIYPEKWIELS